MPFYGIYVRLKVKAELNGTTENWERAKFLRSQIREAAKRVGQPVPTVIIRAEEDITDLPEKF